MKRKLFAVLLTGMLAVLAYGYAQAKEPVDTKGMALKYLAEFEGGKLYSAGKIKVVELTGGYRQMGRQYGALLKNDIEAIHRTIGQVFVEKRRDVFRTLLNRPQSPGQYPNVIRSAIRRSFTESRIPPVWDQTRLS